MSGRTIAEIVLFVLVIFSLVNVKTENYEPAKQNQSVLTQSTNDKLATLSTDFSGGSGSSTTTISGSSLSSGLSSKKNSTTIVYIGGVKVWDGTTSTDNTAAVTIDTGADYTEIKATSGAITTYTYTKK